MLFCHLRAKAHKLLNLKFQPANSFHIWNIQARINFSLIVKLFKLENRSPTHSAHIHAREVGMFSQSYCKNAGNLKVASIFAIACCYLRPMSALLGVHSPPFCDCTITSTIGFEIRTIIPMSKEHICISFDLFNLCQPSDLPFGIMILNVPTRLTMGNSTLVHFSIIQLPYSIIYLYYYYFHSII